jgi:hypothetical protein
MKTPMTTAKTTNEPPQPKEIPKAPAKLIINREGPHAIYQWVVIRCPFCGKKHYHGGGRVGGDPRRLLGSRVSHCSGRCRTTGEYLLVEA